MTLAVLYDPGNTTGRRPSGAGRFSSALGKAAVGQRSAGVRPGIEQGLERIHRPRDRRRIPPSPIAGWPFDARKSDAGPRRPSISLWLRSSTPGARRCRSGLAREKPVRDTARV